MDKKSKKLQDEAFKLSKELVTPMIPILDKWGKEKHELLKVNIALAFAIRRLIVMISLYHQANPNFIVDNIMTGVMADRAGYVEELRRAIKFFKEEQTKE